MTYTNSALLPVTPDEAFALITEPERLRRWKTVSAYVDLRAGGGYRFTVIPGNVAAGTFREVEPGKRLVYGWGWEGNGALPPDASTVTVTIEAVEGGSRRTRASTRSRRRVMPRVGTTTSSGSRSSPPRAMPDRTSGTGCRRS
jgi:uncharacterized protein YndB with AHSA1/START domain